MEEREIEIEEGSSGDSQGRVEGRMRRRDKDVRQRRQTGVEIEEARYSGTSHLCHKVL